MQTLDSSNKMLVMKSQMASKREATVTLPPVNSTQENGNTGDAPSDSVHKLSKQNFMQDKVRLDYMFFTLNMLFYCNPPFSFTLHCFLFSLEIEYKIKD